MAAEKHTLIPFCKEIDITNLISLFYLKSPRNFYFGGEAHDFWEMVYIDKGQLLVTAGNQQYLLKAGELAFHKPNEFHALRAYEGVSANAVISSFVCKNPCMEYFEHRFTTLNAQEREYLYEALRHSPAELGNKGLEHSFGSLQIVQANMELLLLNLIRRVDSAGISTRIESYAQQTHFQRTAEQVNKYLETNITKKLTLELIAKDLGYSASQMKKLYHRQMGRGIIDNFIQMKMDEAKRLLEEGSMNIKQIADSLGYEDTSYFSRVFRKHFDMTPSECARSYTPGDY